MKAEAKFSTGASMLFLTASVEDAKKTCDFFLGKKEYGNNVRLTEAAPIPSFDLTREKGRPWINKKV